MGGFLLIKDRQKQSGLIEDTLEIFHKKNLRLNKKITFKDYSLYVFYKRSHEIENIYYLDENNFLIVVGTFIYNGEVGTNSLKEFFTNFSDKTIDFSKLLGHYCVIINKNAQMCIFNDYEGIYHIYSNIDKSCFSNSFLALSKVIPQKTLSVQEIYEYLFYGTFYGDKTILKEINLLSNKEICKIFPQNVNHTKKYSSFWETCDLTPDSNIEKVSRNIIEYFRSLRDNFQNNIIMGLSGGFDSRLMLASLLANDIKPKVYVSGEENSLDYNISKMISENENLDFTNYRESLENKLATEEFREFIIDKFFNIDCFGNSGLFSFVINMDFLNSQKALLNLNGGAGEIYRNLWYLKDKNLTVNNILKSVYYNFDIKICSNHFDRSTFFQTLEDKIKFICDIRDENLNPTVIQSVYPSFELKYFAGKVISYLNQYSYSLLPFSEVRFTRESNRIPLKYKEAGIFEAALINKINPKIASYISVYGHNFSDEIKLRHKLYDIFLINTPFFIRPILWKIKSKMKALDKPYYLSKQYLKSIFESEEFIMKKYVKLNLIKDTATYSRALTLEYFMQKFF